GFFHDPASILLLERLHGAGLRISTKERPQEMGIGERVFLFTGTLAGLSRNEAKQIVRAAGGQVASSMSRRVTDLVAGAKAGSKLAEAERLGIAVLSEEAFLELMRQTGQGVA
ncbi:MAG: NAD-dependent DNA ligase LigA, partial [bacterium]|nr:NAD-dependent DNA ligase LigA [bacterium]